MKLKLQSKVLEIDDEDYDGINMGKWDRPRLFPRLTSSDVSAIKHDTLNTVINSTAIFQHPSTSAVNDVT